MASFITQYVEDIFLQKGASFSCLWWSFDENWRPKVAEIGRNLDMEETMPHVGKLSMGLDSQQHLLNLFYVFILQDTNGTLSPPGLFQWDI